MKKLLSITLINTSVLSCSMNIISCSSKKIKPSNIKPADIIPSPIQPANLYPYISQIDMQNLRNEDSGTPDNLIQIMKNWYPNWYGYSHNEPDYIYMAYTFSKDHRQGLINDGYYVPMYVKNSFYSQVGWDGKRDKGIAPYLFFIEKIVNFETRYYVYDENHKL